MFRTERPELCMMDDFYYHVIEDVCARSSRHPWVSTMLRVICSNPNVFSTLERPGIKNPHHCSLQNNISVEEYPRLDVDLIRRTMLFIYL